MSLRKIQTLVSSTAHQMGELRMQQPLPSEQLPDLDPFLLLHHHGPHVFEPYNHGLPFAPHPHRGFETLTLVYAGEIEHADSHGHRSSIGPGGVQWMTAGRGIVHSENIPAEMREHGGEVELIQLWMNLPARLKMTPPRYQGLQAADIPVQVSADGLVKVQVISGMSGDVCGGADSITGLTFLNATAQAGGEWQVNIPAANTILFYVLDGELRVNGHYAIGKQLIHFTNEGEDINIAAATNARFLIGYGEPLGEPVVAQGPFVMNSTTEILQAMRDYQMGKMGIM